MLPVLYAATAPGSAPATSLARGSSWRGLPAPSWRAPWTCDDRAGELLRSASEQLTGATYQEL